ncbi:MAG: bifunctional metallophosphatase/5'-nucleotidase [Oscillospiraceae bacterium]|nr:bifunctional metallophosphatase/5'-nucleotidase [Oscillospiraceae bacterium]
MKRCKKALSLFLAAAMALSLGVAAAAADLPNMEGKLVILHTNDTHGADMAGDSSIGTAGVAQLKKDYEAAGAEVLLLSAGDAIQGTPLVNLDNGASAVRFMNAAGYDAMTAGNHEFDWGYENLRSIMAGMDFDLLCANVVNASGQPVFTANKIVTLENGQKVGIFGLATPETATKAHPDKIKGLTFLAGQQMYDCAQRQIDELRAAGCELVVCLGHLGTDLESAPNRSRDVLEHTNGIDLFIDGHSHTEIEGGKMIGTGLLVSTGEKLNNVGVVVYDGNALNAHFVKKADYTGADDAVAKLITDRNEVVTQELGKKFAETKVELNGNRNPGVRTQETNLGDFACDALLWQANQLLGEGKVDAALTNGGGIRATIPAGDVTMETMKTVFPFGNTVAVVTLTGAQLLEAIEAATCATPDEIGAFPQVSGIEYTVNTAIPYRNGAQYDGTTYYAPADPGARVTITSVGGEKFDLKKTYAIATNDFTAAGGDTYAVFKQCSVYDTGCAMEDALVAYTKEVLGGVIGEQYAETAGRITVASLPVDVRGNSGYFNEVKYVWTNHIVGGVGGNRFDPNGAVTRGAVFQTLYNMAGKPTVSESSAFSDVKAGDWYADAAAWAKQNGLTTGVGNNSFGGEQDITRQQLAQLFYEYAGYLDKAGDRSTDLSRYEDADKVAPWAQEGMSWAVANGIVSGASTTKLNPDSSAIRAHLAVILYRFDTLIVNAE